MTAEDNAITLRAFDAPFDEAKEIVTMTTVLENIESTGVPR